MSGKHSKLSLVICTGRDTVHEIWPTSRGSLARPTHGQGILRPPPNTLCHQAQTYTVPSKGAGHLRFGNSLAGPTGKLKPWQLLQEGSESPKTTINSAWFPTQNLNISPITALPTFGWSWSCRWRLAAATSPTSWSSPSLAAASNEAAWGWAGCTRYCFFSSFYTLLTLLLF